MAIEANKYYPKQMNGPVISAFGNVRDEEFSKADFIENYLANLSIDTAEETELENIGRLIGYLRPLVPESFTTENQLILGPVPIIQDAEYGLSNIGQTSGGQFSSLNYTYSNFMNLGLYRKFLKAMATLKRYGITLYSVDQIAKSIDIKYTISWDKNKDIVITYSNAIGYKNVWILTQLFYRIATEPQVLIKSGGN